MSWLSQKIAGWVVAGISSINRTMTAKGSSTTQTVLAGAPKTKAGYTLKSEGWERDADPTIPEVDPRLLSVGALRERTLSVTLTPDGAYVSVQDLRNYLEGFYRTYPSLPLASIILQLRRQFK